MSPRSKRLEQRVTTSSGTVTPARSGKTKRLARQGSESQHGEDLSKSLTYKNSNRTPKLKDTIKPLSQSMKKPVTDGATRKSRRLHLFENASVSGSDIEPQAIPSVRKSVRKIDVDENVSKIPAPKTPRKLPKTPGKTQNVRQKETVVTADVTGITTSSRKSARKTKKAQDFENASTDRDTTFTMPQRREMDTDKNKTSSDEMQTTKKSKKIRRSKKFAAESVSATDDEMIAQEESLAVKRKSKGRKLQKTLIHNNDRQESEGLLGEKSVKMEPLKSASKRRRVTTVKAENNESSSSEVQKDNNEQEQEVNVANGPAPKGRKSQRNLLTRSEESQESDAPVVGKFVKKEITKSSAKRRRNRTVKTEGDEDQGPQLEEANDTENREENLTSSSKLKSRKSLKLLFTSSDDIQEAECSVVKISRDTKEESESEGGPSTPEEEPNYENNLADVKSSFKSLSSETTKPNNDETHEDLLEKEPETFEKEEKEDFTEITTEFQVKVEVTCDLNATIDKDSSLNVSDSEDKENDSPVVSSSVDNEPLKNDGKMIELNERTVNNQGENLANSQTNSDQSKHLEGAEVETSSINRSALTTTTTNNDDSNKESSDEEDPEVMKQDHKQEVSGDATETILEPQNKLEVTCDLNATFDKSASNVSNSEVEEVQGAAMETEDEGTKKNQNPTGGQLEQQSNLKDQEESVTDSPRRSEGAGTTKADDNDINKDSLGEASTNLGQSQSLEKGVRAETTEIILEPQDKLEVTCDLNATFDKSASNVSNCEVEEVQGAAMETEVEGKMKHQSQTGAQLEQQSSLTDSPSPSDGGAEVISSTERPLTGSTKADDNDTNKDSLGEASTNMEQEHSQEKDVCTETTEIILESQNKLEVTCDADTTFDKPFLTARGNEVVQVEKEMETETKSEIVSSSLDNNPLKDDEKDQSAKQITANLEDLEKFYDANQNVSSTVLDQSISDSTFECAEDDSIISVDSYGSIIVIEDTPKPAIKKTASKSNINVLPQARVRPLSSTPILLSSNVSNVKKDVKRLQGKAHTPMNRCRSIADRESTPHVKTFRLSKKVETSISKLAQEEFAQIVKDRPPPKFISAESKLLKSIRKRSLSTSDADISKSIAKNKVTFHSPSNLTIPIEDIDKSLMIYQKSAAKPENSLNLSRKRTHSASVVGSGVKLARAESEGEILTKHKKLEKQPSRTKMPNFSAIHRNKFEKMESIVDHVKKKEEMAKALSASKAKQDSVHRSAKKIDENNKVLTSQDAVPKVVKNPDTSTHNPKAKQKIYLAHIPVESNDKAAAEEEVPKPEVQIAVVTPINKVDKVSERRKKNESMFKARARKDTTITKGNEIVKGVRSNRRFELQMLHRNKK